MVSWRENDHPKQRSVDQAGSLPRVAWKGAARRRTQCLDACAVVIGQEQEEEHASRGDDEAVNQEGEVGWHRCGKTLRELKLVVQRPRARGGRCAIAARPWGGARMEERHVQTAQ